MTHSILFFVVVLLLLPVLTMTVAAESPFPSALPSPLHLGIPLGLLSCDQRNNGVPCRRISAPKSNSTPMGLQAAANFYLEQGGIGVTRLVLSVSSIDTARSDIYPCDSLNNRPLPHFSRNDIKSNGKEVTLLAAFPAGCMLTANLSSWASPSSESSSNNHSVLCEFAHDDHEEQAGSSTVPFVTVHQGVNQALRRFAVAKNGSAPIPPELAAGAARGGVDVATTVPLHRIALCGRVTPSSSTLPSLPALTVLHAETYSLHLDETAASGNALSNLNFWSVNATETLPPWPATASGPSELRAGLPAQIETATASLSESEASSSSSSSNDWCSGGQSSAVAASKKKKTKAVESDRIFSFTTPVSTPLSLRVVDAWGNPCSYLSSAQLESFFGRLSLRVAAQVPGGTVATLPLRTAGTNSTRRVPLSAAAQAEQLRAMTEVGAGVFCVSEKRDLWSVAASSSSLRVSGFSFSFCPSMRGYIMSSAAASASSTRSTGGGSVSMGPAPLRQLSLLRKSGLLAHLAAGEDIEMKLVLDMALVPSSASSASASLAIGNSLRRCLGRRFRLRPALNPRALHLTMMPSPSLPWHVLKASHSNSYDDEHAQQQQQQQQQSLHSVDPFSFTWGDLALSTLDSQATAWLRAASTALNSADGDGSDANSQHYAVSVSQAQLKSATGGLTSMSSPPAHMLVSTHIVLTDRQGLALRGGRGVELGVEGSGVCSTSSSSSSSSGNSSSTSPQSAQQSWCLACDGWFTMDDENDAGLVAGSVSISSIKGGRWSAFPASATEPSTSSSSSASAQGQQQQLKAAVEFMVPVDPAKGHVIKRPSSYWTLPDSGLHFSVRCKARLVHHTNNDNNNNHGEGEEQAKREDSATTLVSGTSLLLASVGEYQCANIGTAEEFDAALSRADATTVAALVRSVSELQGAVPLAAALSPPLVQVFLPPTVAVESELAFGSPSEALPLGKLLSSELLSATYDPRLGVPWFPKSGVTSWVLIPRTSYLNIPLGIMTSLSFGTSYATTRRLVLAFERPLCSSSANRLEGAVSSWVYAMARNLTSTLTHSTVLGGKDAQVSSTIGSAMDMAAEAASTSSTPFAAATPRKSSFTLQHAATGIRQTTDYLSCYGPGVSTLEFVSLQCCDTDANSESAFGNVPTRGSVVDQAHQRQLLASTTGGSFFDFSEAGSGGLGGDGDGAGTCGVYFLASLSMVMVAGAGAGGVIAAVAITIYCWLILSGSTTELKAWREMTASEQWRAIMFHFLAPFVPLAHAYYNYGSSTFSAFMLFWIDMGFAGFWYFGLLVFLIGRCFVDGTSRRGFFAKTSRWTYVLSQVLLLAYSHFLVVNAGIWLAASLHINMALVPYAVGYSVIAIEMWFSVQFMASELEPSIVTGRFPATTMAPIDSALSCSYFVIIVVVFMNFVAQVEGLTPFMGIAAAFIIFLLLLIFNFAPGESIRLALQSQMDDGGGGDGENKGSRLADFLHHVVGGAAGGGGGLVPVDNEGDNEFGYDEDDDEMMDGVLFEPGENGPTRNGSPSSMDSVEMRRQGSLSNNNGSFSSAPLSPRSPPRGSGSSRGNGPPAIDAELAAKLLTTVPKLLEAGQADGGGGGGAALNADDVATLVQAVAVASSTSGHQIPSPAAAAVSSSGSGGGGTDSPHTHRHRASMVQQQRNRSFSQRRGPSAGGTAAAGASGGVAGAAGGGGGQVRRNTIVGNSFNNRSFVNWDQDMAQSLI